MNWRISCGFFCAVLVSFVGCSLEHRALVRSAELPPLPSPVLHSSRLWVELEDGVNQNTCISPENLRPICFDGLRHELADALSRALWTSFPGVELDHGEPSPGDYVLRVTLGVEALAPDATNPGWSAGARGNWRLERDGKLLAGEQVASRSRAEFAYGAPLGVGAGEVIDAVAVRIGMTLGSLPETRVLEPVPLPAVATAPLPAAEGPKPAAGASAKTGSL
ncbi:MAG TPA: hypothetical protein VGM44_16665 [Polyangiaceae bacterium]|jgi:hypothetical protein